MMIILATNNKGKVKEIKEILKNEDIKTLKEMNINIEIEESEGIHLYSLACIYSAFDAIAEIHIILKPEYEQSNRLKVEAMNKLENATKKYNQEIKKYNHM